MVCACLGRKSNEHVHGDVSNIPTRQQSIAVIRSSPELLPRHFRFMVVAFRVYKVYQAVLIRHVWTYRIGSVASQYHQCDGILAARE
jgi:hypothetical protein